MTKTEKQSTEHPYGAEWVRKHEAAARRNERIDFGRSETGHMSARCLSALVDGECVCR